MVRFRHDALVTAGPALIVFFRTTEACTKVEWAVELIAQGVFGRVLIQHRVSKKTLPTEYPTSVSLLLGYQETE